MEGISWLASHYGVPIQKHVREGFDVRVCVLRASEVLEKPELIVHLDGSGLHTIKVEIPQSRVYRKELVAKRWVPKASQPSLQVPVCTTEVVEEQSQPSLQESVIPDVAKPTSSLQETGDSTDGSALPEAGGGGGGGGVTALPEAPAGAEGIHTQQRAAEASMQAKVLLPLNPVADIPITSSRFAALQCNDVTMVTDDSHSSSDKENTGPSPVTFGDYLRRSNKVPPRRVGDVVALLEPRVRRNNEQKLFTSRFHGWVGDFCYEDTLGKIWLLWRPDLPLQVLRKTSQFIHVEIQLPQKFFISFVYASNYVSLCKDMFAGLSQCSPTGFPWLVVGDFNAILQHEDASNVVTSFTSMDDFRKFVGDAHLDEHPSLGPHFTWVNHREASLIARKLDRALMNTDWQVTFPRSTVRVLPCQNSDHCALLVQTDAGNPSYPKPFKYFNIWADHPSFLRIVQDSWRLRVQGTPLYCLTRKLKVLKGKLRELNRSEFSDIQLRVCSVRKELEVCQLSVFTSPTVEALARLKTCTARLEGLERIEEGILRQKARVPWIQLGDRNTKFFSNYVRARQSRNTIRQLADENEMMVDGTETMAALAVFFYKSLLGTSSYAGTCNLDGLVDMTVTEDQQQMLDADVSRDEIQAALFSMKGDKAPGPDGYTADFFKRSWAVTVWNPTISVSCPLYYHESEDIDHLFVRCNYSRELLEDFDRFAPATNWEEMISYVSSAWPNNPIRNFQRLWWCALVSELWRERCRRIFAGACLSMEVLRLRIRGALASYGHLHTAASLFGNRLAS
ncbi:hypothetical protein LINGRAHAP2_LOCUS34221 [Linum grandiflorum]